jgi:ketol-acid reductoisomerase
VLAAEPCILTSFYLQGVRGIKTLDFAGTKEVVYERSDWPLAKLQDYFKNDTLALIGYGSQGHGQGLNARDNGLNVIVGVRKDGESWRQAMEDGWVRLLITLRFTVVLIHSIRCLERPSFPSRRPSTREPSS